MVRPNPNPNPNQVWGSPYQPEFCGWAFNLPRGEVRGDIGEI